MDKQPYQILEEFYSSRRIKNEDIQSKYRAMKEIVMIPDFPYTERKPALFELEEQFLKERNYKI